MNYAVYSYGTVDGQTVCRIYAYKMAQDANGVRGFHLMTKDEATALSQSISTESVSTMVLPLEPDKEITAF